ncbi:hypothetical protein ZWY2020_048432, partial [Hordeum vulgare]
RARDRRRSRRRHQQRGIYAEWTAPPLSLLASLFTRSVIQYPMTSSLVTLLASSLLLPKRPRIFSQLEYLPRLQLQRKQQTWFHELEQSGVVADIKLIPCRTLRASEDRISMAR